MYRSRLLVAGVAKRGLLGALVASAVFAAPAAAAPPLVWLSSANLVSSSAKASDCSARPLAGAGIVKRGITSPSDGWVTARLKGSGGDWDLAIFGNRGRLVAGSSEYGADEVAQGIASKGERLSVQACRRSGTGSSARLSVDSRAFSRQEVARASFVKVSTPTQARKRELSNMGLDLTEHGGKNFVEVMVHGAADAAQLRKHQFVFVDVVRDVAKQDQTFRARDAAYDKKVKASAFPSGRTSYRRLNDYESEMKKLAADNPGLVKTLSLPFKTWLGRTVQGIEITTNPNARDGKPVFLQMGVHHAREWPSSEHAMEWAYELVNGYKKGDARVRRLVETTRTIVIPVVNPDGFNTSREAGEAAGAGGGRGGPDETPNIAIPYEYQRKNCRVVNPNGEDPPRGDCTQVGQPNVGLSQFGVDPNRNYGGFWGGPGASAGGEDFPGGDYAQDYRGNGPFSEPETQNIRNLVSHRQVTTLITNHTFSGLVLRPPGIQIQGDPFDEPAYKALGDSMAKENGYTSEKSFQLYDTTGATEDWSYYSTGGFGFTFEIGPAHFHPPFADTVAEYEGTSDAAKAIGGHGNREAYFKAMENTADISKHSLLYGRGPSGGVIRVKKSFKTSTSPVIDKDKVEGKPILFDDALNSTMAVPDGGIFNWNVNPSTRPLVAKQRGRTATGKPSPRQDFNTNPPPGAPCPQSDLPPVCYHDFPLTVPQGPGIDNARATVQVKWTTAATDYDVTVYRDTDGNGSSTDEPDSAVVGSSAQGTTKEESASWGEPAETISGKKYVVRVLNFAGAEPYDVHFSFGGPAPLMPPAKENWTFTCEVPEGHVVTSQQVYVARGERKKVDLRACVARACIATASGRVRKTTVGNARLSRGRRAQRRKLKGRLLSKRGGFDRYCVRGGGAMRIGYPLLRLRKKLSRKERKRVRNRAMVILTTNRSFRIKSIRRGSTVKSLRRKVKGEKSFRIGRNRWYIARGTKARIVFKTRGKRVIEVGLADKRLTRTKRIAKRTLASWEIKPKAKKKAKKKRK